MAGVIAAGLAGYGALLLYTACVLRWEGFGPRSRVVATRRARPVRAWFVEAGLSGGHVAQIAGASALLVVVTGGLAFFVCGGLLPAVLAGLFAAGVPPASFRARRQRQLSVAQEAWPRLLEELRLLSGSLGRSIPQALFEVGHHAPDELRPAFRAAEREWLLTTDFDATAATLRQRMADPAADVVTETLVIAHELGGGDLDRRLAALIEDRTLELQDRKDANTKLAGVRFARRFVLLVPLGMALAGLSIGTGRSAYQSSAGQLAVAVGILAVATCWMWSGRLLRLPTPPRVFGGDRDPGRAPPR